MQELFERQSIFETMPMVTNFRIQGQDGNFANAGNTLRADNIHLIYSYK